MHDGRHRYVFTSLAHTPTHTHTHTYYINNTQMRGNSVKYVPEIMYISRDRVAVEGNINNFGDIFYAIHEASGCYLLCSNSI